MARSKITSASKDLIKDNGSVLVSIIQGEQLQLELTLNWLINLTGYEISAVITEALNDGKGNVPLDVLTSGVVTTLPLLNPVTTDNKITLVIPKDLSDEWAVQPTPDRPSYGFIDVVIKDTGLGNEQQIWKPFRGLVEVRYSPTQGV
jgi:hypothetical protein